MNTNVWLLRANASIPTITNANTQRIQLPMQIQTSIHTDHQFAQIWTYLKYTSLGRQVVWIVSPHSAVHLQIGFRSMDFLNGRKFSLGRKKVSFAFRDIVLPILEGVFFSKDGF